MNRYRPLLAALLIAALGTAQATYLDDGGYFGSGHKSDDSGGVIGSGTSFLDDGNMGNGNRGGYFGSGN